MAIDGRDIAKARAAAEAGPVSLTEQGNRDAYTSPAVRLLSHALVWVPLLAIVWFAYESGSWIGGWTMGVVNVAGALVTFAAIWAWRKLHRRRG